MNNTFTKEALAGWIKGLMQAAKEDERFELSWFIPTKDSRFSIIGGWVDGYNPDYADLFCMSKSCPTKAMCIDVVDNEDILITIEEEVEPTHIVLEWDDNPICAAEFFMHEWERLMETCK
jgi:hypothetical protein